MKKISIILLMIFFVLSSCNNNTAKKSANSGELTIIHMNDTHGKDEEEIIINKELIRVLVPI